MFIEIARDYSNLQQVQAEITPSHFGPMSLKYIPPWLNGSVFAKYYPYDPPLMWKLHVCPTEPDALRVARTVLPILLRWEVPHKVVYDLERYVKLSRGNQRGKFITIYTGGASLAQQVVEWLDGPLLALGVRRRYPPTTRESGHKATEVSVGATGLIFARYCDGDD